MTKAPKVLLRIFFRTLCSHNQILILIKRTFHPISVDVSVSVFLFIQPDHSLFEWSDSPILVKSVKLSYHRLLVDTSERIELSIDIGLQSFLDFRKDIGKVTFV